MTRAEAATTLRSLRASTPIADYVQALEVAIKALEPAKPRKPKVDRNLKAFLAIKFPTPYIYVENAREVEGRMNPEARSQFAYTGKRKLDKAVLLAAKVPGV